MIDQQQSDAVLPNMLTLGVPRPSVARPTKAVDIVRAESELLAIDELMANLVDDFVAETRR